MTPLKGAGVGLGVYLLTNFGRKVFKEWTGNKTVIQNLKHLPLHIKTLSLNYIDMAYASAAGAYISCKEDDASTTKKNILRTWGFISLVRTLKSILICFSR